MSLGVGIIGTGVMGADHARTLARTGGGAHLVAIADADADRAGRVAAEVGARRTHAEGHALIADAEVEAVLIASPDHTHADLVLACLKAGKPVLCEKPLASTTAECQKILDAEMALGRRLVQVGFMRRFDPAYTAMKAALQGGEVGAPVMLHCLHHNAIMPAFFETEMLITNAAVHEIDIARWLLGQEIAYATAFQPATNAAVPDRMLLVLETASGVLIDVALFLNAHYGYDVRAELVCERASLARAPRDPVVLRSAASEGSAMATDWRAHFEAAYRLQLQHWLRSIKEGQPTGASAWDGYATTAIAAACVAAAKSGQRTRIELPPRPAFYS